ncbi:hypothetical protein [Pedomonas mirosovicensis]|uniref:hypothetical protein n=1 Tax=Pedomonas mirosovicensis TaxID=2908641 RepID=UPI0021699037|nr:hypothetical protein [Pedomonas mirosovicensis]MCH8684842.1 hypothetical protein [Pedomonas mirosovicensis]
MPLLLFLVLVALIATFGFWDTLAAILGGVAVVLLIALVLAVIAAFVGWRMWKRFVRRYR